MFLAALLLIPFVGTRRTFLVFAVLLGPCRSSALPRRAAVVPPRLRRPCCSLPVGDAQVDRQRAGDLGDGDPVRLRAGARAGRRRPAARAERGPGDPLRVPPGHVPDRQLLGRVPGAAVRHRPRRRGRSRSSATPPEPSPARTATTSPRARVDAVEIDGALTDVGRRLFDLRGPDLHLHTADARPFLRRTDRRCDAIPVDAYRQPYIPFYLVTREFFAGGPRPPGARRHGDGQRRPPGGLRAPGEGAGRDDGRRLRPRDARPERGHQHDPRRHATRPCRRRPSRRPPRPPAWSPWRARRPGGSRRPCGAATSTPTTARRWSG